MSSDPEAITFKGSIKRELSVGLSFHKDKEPLACLTRVGLKGFNYRYKEAGIQKRWSMLSVWQVLAR